MLSNITLLANEDSSDSGSSRRGGFGGVQPPEGFEGGMPDFGGEMPEGFRPTKTYTQNILSDSK